MSRNAAISNATWVRPKRTPSASTRLATGSTKRYSGGECTSRSRNASGEMNTRWRTSFHSPVSFSSALTMITGTRSSSRSASRNARHPSQFDLMATTSVTLDNKIVSLRRPSTNDRSVNRARLAHEFDRRIGRRTQTSLDSTIGSTARPWPHQRHVTESMFFAMISGSSTVRSPPTVKWWKERMDVVSTTSNRVRFPHAVHR